jgi:hypothetical protein
MWLDCPVEETDDWGRKTRTTEARDKRSGAPQGSPLSPLLANIYMRRFVLGWKMFGLERTLGNIASPVVSASPVDVVKGLWGGELPPFDNIEANELISALAMGLWNQLQCTRVCLPIGIKLSATRAMSLSIVSPPAIARLELPTSASKLTSAAAHVVYVWRQRGGESHARLAHKHKRRLKSTSRSGGRICQFS